MNAHADHAAGLKRTATALLLPALAAGHAAAQQEMAIEVSAGETLTESDLSSGTFPGANVAPSFTLAPGTVFDINAGGAIGPVGGFDQPFDFRGSTVNINSGGLFHGTSSVSNITVNIFEGGDAGDRFQASGSTVNILGGRAGNGAGAFDSTVNIAGGSVGAGFSAFGGSTVNISGGSLGDGFSASGNTTTNISDGRVGNGYSLSFGSKVNISGGSIGDHFFAFSGSAVNLFVTQVATDGIDLGLGLGETREIDRRGESLLEATLIDGSTFELILDTDPSQGLVQSEDFVSSGATLTVTRVPTPGTAAALGLAGFIAVRRRRG